MTRKGTSAAVLALLCGCAAWPVSSAAQDERGSSAGEIVVTALRESEPLATIAAPVSVVRGKTVLDGAITAPDRLAEFSTALTVLPNATANIIFLRGIGNFTLTPSTDPAVGWNYDGVFVARANGTQGQFFDLERVEILKGPQGVLYGRNASAGSINLLPVQPQLGELGGFVSGSYASRDTANVEGALNLPLGPNGALRVSGQALSQDNYLSGYDDGARQQSLRVQLKSALQPGLAVRVSGDYTQQRGIGIGTTYLGYYAYDAAGKRYRVVPSNLDLGIGNRDPLAQAFRQTVPLPTLGRNLDVQMAVPYQNNELYGAHAEIVADLGFGTLMVIPAWRRNEFDQVLAGAPFGYGYREDADQRSVEARLAGTTGPVDWLVGGLIFDEDIRARYATNLSTQLANSDSRYGTRSRALFANGTVTIAPGLRLVGGVRRSWDEKSLSAITTTYTLGCGVAVSGRPACPSVPLLQLGDSPAAAGLPVPAAGARPPIFVNGVNTGATITRADRVDADRAANFAVTTWRAGAEADLGAQGVAYATVQTGYRPGGLNTAVGFETYAPERVTAYTLGARWHSAGRMVSLTGEAFWWNYRDQHVSAVQPDLSNPPRNVNFTRNVARSRIRGLAGEAVLRPTARTTLLADVQYLDSSYLDYTFVQTVTGTNPPLTGCAAALTTSAGLYSVDCTGERPFASPEWTVNLSARQGFALAGGELAVMARTRYVSAQNVGATLLDEQTVPAHWTSDAQLEFTTEGGKLELAAFVRNISGKRFPTFVIFHPASNLLVSSVSPPRVIGVRMGMKF